VILPKIKEVVLFGKRIVFSGIIPIGIEPTTSEIWNLATSFGAAILNDLDSTVTHLVCGRKGTAKARKASSIPGCKVVNTEWLMDSISGWRALDETKYLIQSATEVLITSTDSSPQDIQFQSFDPQTIFDEHIDEEDLNAMLAEVEAECGSLDDEEENEDSQSFQEEEERNWEDTAISHQKDKGKRLQSRSASVGSEDWNEAELQELMSAVEKGTSEEE